MITVEFPINLVALFSRESSKPAPPLPYSEADPGCLMQKPLGQDSGGNANPTWPSDRRASRFTLWHVAR